MHKSVITTVVAIAALSSAACASGPYGGSYGGPGPRADYARGGCYAGERRDDCSERLRYEQRSNRHYVWRNDHYEPQDTAGAAVAGAVIGFILGTAIAGSTSDRDYYNAHKNDRDWHNRCASTYQGYDSRTGTYVGPDGYRRYCTR
jgi:hypothetical protein